MHSREKGIRMTVELDNDHGTFWSINRGLNWSRNRSVKLVPEQSQEPRSSMPNSVGCNTWNPHSLIENMLDRNDYGWSSRNRSSGQHHEHLARTHQQSYGPIWTIFKQSWNNEFEVEAGKSICAWTWISHGDNNNIPPLKSHKVAGFQLEKKLKYCERKPSFNLKYSLNKFINFKFPISNDVKNWTK